MTETATDGARILRRLLSIGTALALVGLTACESSTGPDGSASVSIGFRAASGGSASASVAGAGVDGSSESGVSPAIEFSGSNGTLSIDEAHLVVTEFEVSRADVDCDDDGGGEECEEFETGPQFTSDSERVNRTQSPLARDVRCSARGRRDRPLSSVGCGRAQFKFMTPTSLVISVGFSDSHSPLGGHSPRGEAA